MSGLESSVEIINGFFMDFEVFENGLYELFGQLDYLRVMEL